VVEALWGLSLDSLWLLTMWTNQPVGAVRKGALVAGNQAKEWVYGPEVMKPI